MTVLRAIAANIRVVPVSWSDKVVGEFELICVLRHSIKGVLAMMALAVSDAKANIDDIVVESHTDQHAVVLLKPKVSDRRINECFSKVDALSLSCALRDTRYDKGVNYRVWARRLCLAKS